MDNNNSIIISKMENNNIEQNNLSKFNFESIITIEEILSYFLNDEIKLTKINFINFYKISHYYIIIDSTTSLFKSNSNYSKQLEQLFNLQFITILIDGLYLFNQKNNNKEIKNIIKDCLLKNHQNFLLLSQILSNELQQINMTNIYSNKICKLLLEKLKYKNIYKLKDIFIEIDKNNKEINNQIKSMINTKKLNYITPKGISPLSNIINNLEKMTSKNIFEYCLKMLEVPEKEIKEIKNRTYLSIQDEDDSSPVYQSVSVPFLPPLKNGEEYNLSVVLDLDETLISFEKEEIEEEENEEENEEIEEEENKKMMVRPGLYEFLDNLMKLKCELVIFTSSNKKYAEKIIDEIEKDKKYFKKRLYRENCVLIGSAYVKDLSKLGRDLSKTIIIDNDFVSFYLQQENGILIKPFTGKNNEQNDKTLFNLYNIILKIIKEPFQDIRIEIEKYREEIKNTINK